MKTLFRDLIKLFRLTVMGMVLLLILISAVGCRGDDEEEAADAAAAGGSAPASRPSRTSRSRGGRSSRGGGSEPAAATTSSANATAGAGNAVTDGTPTRQQAESVISSREIPVDRLLPLLPFPDDFNVTEIPEYPRRMRTNPFRDIKRSAQLRSAANTAIESAKVTIERVESMGEDGYIKSELDRSKSRLKDAENAFSSTNFLKAESLARLASDLANGSLLDLSRRQGDQPARFNALVYKGFYTQDGMPQAIISKQRTPRETPETLMVGVGEIITDDSIGVGQRLEELDNSGIKRDRIDYRIIEITPRSLIMHDLLGLLPPQRLLIDMSGAKTSGGSSSTAGSQQSSADSRPSGTGTLPSFEDLQTAPGRSAFGD